MTTNLNKASAGYFQLIFPVVPGANSLDETEPLTLNIYQTLIPSFTLASTELPWMGGKVNTYSGDATYEPWFVHFLVDERWDNWTLLFNWMTYIHNNNDRFGRHPDEFIVDATLIINDAFKTPVKKFTLYRVWPNFLSEITLTSRDNTEYLMSNMNLMYDRYVLENI